ncbi:MAG: hypothetical protein ABIS50_11490 [Luteolibacter sp.]|uniref:hypothetical protein n=1 Tax=Luteolibacter sp. TaxID=1962973 RepID=UPI0032631341
MNPKPIFQSKTIVGALIMAATIAAQFYQAPVSQDEINQAGGQLQQVLEGVSALVGLVMVIYGRMKATRPVTILGK